MDDAKRALLLEARAERETKATLAKKAHEDLCLELDDRFSSELGVRGRDWEMVNESENSNGEGPIVLKLGDPVAHKLWLSRPGSSPEDSFAYVKPMVVYPDGPAFAALAVRRPILLLRCVIAVSELFGQNRAVALGKV
jgi:hypothetical protein